MRLSIPPLRLLTYAIPLIRSISDKRNIDGQIEMRKKVLLVYLLYSLENRENVNQGVCVHAWVFCL